MIAQGSSILVVDDDDAFRNRLVRALCDRGHFARGAATYEEAIASAKNEPPEFGVIDIRVSERSGLDLAQDLRRFFPTIHIVLLTGPRSTGLAAVDLRMANVSKPADADDILAALDRARSLAADRSTQSRE